MDTTEIIVLCSVYGFVIVAYCLGTWATMRAKREVAEMDKQDDANDRYEQIMRDVQVWTKGGQQ